MGSGVVLNVVFVVIVGVVVVYFLLLLLMKLINEVWNELRLKFDFGVIFGIFCRGFFSFF